MRCLECILPLLLIESVSGFASAPSGSRYHCLIHVCWSATGDATATHATMDPKEAVKLFGRLAEKYIMLDPTAGMCCYSGCTDCEFRLPGGGYRMADQSAARPKWIPIYEQRSVEATGKEHATKWSTQIFVHGPAVTKDAFVETLTGLEYAPPLGGPYLSTSAAQLDDVAPAEALFDLLAGGKEKLTKHRMGIRLKEMANREEGINWATFQAAVGIS